MVFVVFGGMWLHVDTQVVYWPNMYTRSTNLHPGRPGWGASAPHPPPTTHTHTHTHTRTHTRAHTLYKCPMRRCLLHVTCEPASPIHPHPCGAVASGPRCALLQTGVPMRCRWRVLQLLARGQLQLTLAPTPWWWWCACPGVPLRGVCIKTLVVPKSLEKSGKCSFTTEKKSQRLGERGMWPAFFLNPSLAFLR